MRGVLAEAAGDFAGVVDAAVNDRRGIDALFKDDGHLLLNVRFGEGPEALGGIGGQREIHLVLTGVVGAAIFRGAAEVPSGDNRRAIEEIPDFDIGGAGIDASRTAGNKFGAGRKNAAMLLHEVGLRGVGDGISHQLQFELAAGLNHLLGAGGIAFAGELHENLVVFAAVKLNGGLR